MKQRLIYTLLALSSFSLLFAQRQMEELDHGLVAVKVEQGVFLSWRISAQEYDKTIAFNLYRNATKVNEQAIVGASNWTDAKGSIDDRYQIRAIVNGAEQSTDTSVAVWAQNYFDLALKDVNGSFTTHYPNDASVGDLDGDGDYEIVIKRIAVDMSEASTDYHLLEAYQLDGTFMWRVNMGPNIYNDKEFNFLVWDLDGDGKAEVTTRTSEGAIDGIGQQIGDIDGDGITNYRYSISEKKTGYGFRSEGPDFLSILNGETGAERARETYIPRGNIIQWGLAGMSIAQTAHRSTKCMFTVAYLDGKRPSVVFGRGIYEKIALEAWNYRDGELSQVWHFDSDQAGNAAYAKQGFHNLSQGDVDNDGRDEIMYGSMCIDDDGTGLYSTGLQHGDAQHLADINPTRKGLEYFGCLENSPYYGGNYRDAGTGEILFHQAIGRDMGRAACADVTPQYPGMEMWGPTGFPFLSATGEAITDLSTPTSMNFFIWWDDDPIRELLDHQWYSDHGVGTITKYDQGKNTRLLYAEGTLSNNGTKGTPALSADLLGDWREEVIWRTNDNKAIRIYTTTIPTTHRFYTLMHDPQYRAAIGWQPNSYNQPPHPSFFIGHGMDSIPPAPILAPHQKVWQSGVWNDTESSWTLNQTTTQFQDGDEVLFDISGDHSSSITLSEDVAPGNIRVIAPNDYTFTGSGTLAGKGTMTKAGRGQLTINTEASYTGKTRVWDGQLTINGQLSNSHILAKRFSCIAGNGHLGNGLTLEQYAELIVSDKKGRAGTLSIDSTLSIASATMLYFDLSDDPTGTNKANDQIILNGRLSWDKMCLNCNRLNDTLGIGDYILIKSTEHISGQLEDISIEGIEGDLYTLAMANNQLILRISEKRAPTLIYWQGASSNIWDLVQSYNWNNKGSHDYFRAGDQVVFNDNTTQEEIEVRGQLPADSVIFQTSKPLLLRGEGNITGQACLVKNGTGKVTINTQNTYTGKTLINAGTLLIDQLGNENTPSPLGAANADADKIICNGGTLEIQGPSASTDRGITLEKHGGTLTISNPNAIHTLTGDIAGEGQLTKQGEGVLALKGNNTYAGGTWLQAGSIQLLDDDANASGLGTGTITITQGTIVQYDNNNTNNSSAYHIHIPKNGVANYILDTRILLHDTLTGEGTLNLSTYGIRSELQGDWSSFSGHINVLTDNDGGDFRVNNTDGYPKASLHLSDRVKAYRTTYDTLHIGQLTGTSNAYLSNAIFVLGEKNKDSKYKGSIVSGELIKTGQGRLILSSPFNYYKNGTTVKQGTLWLANTDGTATGEGDVEVAPNAILGGKGTSHSNIELHPGAYLVPSYDYETFTTTKNIKCNAGSIISFNLDVANANNGQVRADTILFEQSFIFLINKSTAPYGNGEQFKIFDANTLLGEVKNIYPKQPADGLYWDTRELYTKGIIKTTDTAPTAIKESHKQGIKIYPTLTDGPITIEIKHNKAYLAVKLYDQNGRRRPLSVTPKGDHQLRLNIADQTAGFYFLEVSTDGGTSMHKICKQ